MDTKPKIASPARRTLLLTSLLGSAGTLAPITVHAATPVPPKLVGKRLYFNPLRSTADLAGFRLEGSAQVTASPLGMRLKNDKPPELGQESNFVLWCPEVFPDQIEIRWNFTPVAEPGLCVFFFAAQGLFEGKEVSVFDPRLKPRQGLYDQYTKSDVSALQIAYFRRRYPSERAFHLAILRRAPGFTLLAQGADPIPNVDDATPPYRICIQKRGRNVRFFINDLLIFNGDDQTPHATAGSGCVGFRQMAPLEGLYSDLEVLSLSA